MERILQHGTKLKCFLLTFPHWAGYETTLVFPFHSGHVLIHFIDDHSRGILRQSCLCVKMVCDKAVCDKLACDKVV